MFRASTIFGQSLRERAIEISSTIKQENIQQGTGIESQKGAKMSCDEYDPQIGKSPRFLRHFAYNKLPSRATFSNFVFTARSNNGDKNSFAYYTVRNRWPKILDSSQQDIASTIKSYNLNTQTQKPGKKSYPRLTQSFLQSYSTQRYPSSNSRRRRTRCSWIQRRNYISGQPELARNLLVVLGMLSIPTHSYILHAIGIIILEEL